MISVHQALEKVLGVANLMPEEPVDLDFAGGRVLVRDAIADRDHPPFHRVTMDGIAIREVDFRNGTNTFKVEHTLLAGQHQDFVARNGCGVWVMTGAPLPPGMDTVIRMEDLLKHPDDLVEIVAATVIPGQNVHPKGADTLAGKVVIPAGTVLHAGHIAILATMGYNTVSVYRLPKVMVLVTGNELVEVSSKPLPYQIRQSNGWMLVSLLQLLGVRPQLLWIRDDFSELTAAVENNLGTYDVLVTTGGVSMGTVDHLPVILRNLGVNEIFHRVAQRPGKPLWFGKRNNTLVFGLPGNPMSVLVTATFYLIAAIKKMSGSYAGKLKKAVLTTTVNFKPQSTCFLPVKVQESPDGRIMAFPIQGNGSGDLIQMATLDGWLLLPASRSHFDAGEVLEFLPMPIV